MVPEATKQGYAVAAPGDSINLSVMGSATPRGRVGKGIAQTLDTGMQQYTIHQRPRGKNKGGEHDIAPTMTGKSYQDNNLVGAIRRLTPTECERLQGFPDGWTAKGIKIVPLKETGKGIYQNFEEVDVSDTQRYKTLGNAVTTNVVQAVMTPIFESWISSA